MHSCGLLTIMLLADAVEMFSWQPKTFPSKGKGRYSYSSTLLRRNEQDINFFKGVSQFLYQGDIAMTAEQVRQRGRRAVTRDRRAKWSLPLPYYFDSNFPPQGRERVLEAMRYWSEKTCVTFREDRRQRGNVRIFQGSGCWSYVGRQYRLFSQPLSLDVSCTHHLFVVAHELAHALGLYHEHARSDRDRYISIDYSNTNANLTFAFNKEDSSTTDNLGTSYEYGSVMHYALDQFARDASRPVIYAKDRKYERSMGNRMRATFQDILQMNLLYNCNGW
ncbi:unnamed protein product [Caenorhabditis auriculariae]|uniref:Metalloendopeptidase n=1 Tax=Caenorhabditis auriculariae TaxID=2777116 RepID=A0A8S1HQE8_9PELO|nr:unnamed protein product [Caenorhabditis auriculariae]